MKAGEEKLYENGISPRRERGEPPPDQKKERMSASLQTFFFFFVSRLLYGNLYVFSGKASNASENIG